MGPALAALLMQTAGQAVGQGMGLGVGEINNRRNLTQQRHLQNLQVRGQKELTDYNQASALQMWKDTNYSAQMEELKKAGLNPALLYGMSGGGGTTAQVTQGNVSGGHVPTPSSGADMGNMGQMVLLKAQKDNIEADTAKKIVEANKLKGPDTIKTETETASLLQGIENAKAQKELTEVQTRIEYVKEHVATMTQNQAVQLIQTELKKNLATLSILENEKTISTNTVKQKEGIIRMTYALMVIESWKKTAETINIDQQTRESVTRVSLAIQNNMREWDKVVLELGWQGLKLDELQGTWDDIPRELKDVLDQILIIPGMGRGRPPAVGGFHKR